MTMGRFTGVVCGLMMMAFGCDQAEPQADSEAFLAELGVTVVSFEADTVGACSCRDIWDDHDGDGEEDPDELTPGWVEPEATARLRLAAEGPITLSIRVLEAAVHRVDAPGLEVVPATHDERGFFEPHEVVLDAESTSGRTLWFPTKLGEFEVDLGGGEGEWAWHVTFEVTGPDGAVGVVTLQTPPFFIEQSVAG